MIPAYTVHVAHQDGWWVAQIVDVDGGDPAPVRQRTQSVTLPGVWDMTRDLIATVLDCDEDAFTIDVEVRPFLNS